MGEGSWANPLSPSSRQAECRGQGTPASALPAAVGLRLVCPGAQSQKQKNASIFALMALRLRLAIRAKDAASFLRSADCHEPPLGVLGLRPDTPKGGSWQSASLFSEACKTPHISLKGGCACAGSFEANVRGLCKPMIESPSKPLHGF